MRLSVSRLFFLASAVLSACGHSSEKPAAPVSAKGGVIEAEWRPVVSLKPSRSATFPGELKPWNQVGIYARVNGFVRSVMVDRGARVRKGQVLAVLDAPEIHAELSRAEAQTIAAKADQSRQIAHLAASSATYKRLLQTDKVEAGAVSANEIEQARSRFWSDSAAVNVAGEQLKAAEALYRSKSGFAEYLTLRAPFDGVITERNISPGALVGPGELEKPLFMLEDSRILRLTVAVPETFSGAVPADATASFSVTAFPDMQFYARMARSSGSLESQNRSMTVEFDADNRKGSLKAGMYANVSIPLMRQDSTLFVPVSSVVTSSEKVFVIRVRDGLAEWVPVKKGIVADSLVEVFGDLHSGDTIVRDGTEEIRGGDPLRLTGLK